MEKKTLQRYNYDIYTYIIIHLNDTCPFVPLMLGCKGVISVVIDKVNTTLMDQLGVVTQLTI